ncbi:hypothetical protein CPB84DRAFT_1827613 [Gymnopilus junonius]|uniref:Uncharacterized protein n=1 Tax=Gymnopilus junonius TaxID=109634 RepID=A0A9P5NEF2_GYMJU|nr:hypothetical protein CPB84DRAFT_1827613 [Gymnopilus junonius]
MSAWKGVPTPTTILKPFVSQPQKRSFHISKVNAQDYPFSTPGLLAKARFRANGRPRSLWVGAATAAIGTLILYSLFRTKKSLEKSTLEAATVCGILCVLRVDQDYTTVDFDDPIATYAHFRNLLGSLFLITTDKREEVFEKWDEVARGVTVQGETPTATDERAHTIMREAAVKVHEALRQFNHRSIEVCTRRVWDEIAKAIFFLDQDSVFKVALLKLNMTVTKN